MATSAKPQSAGSRFCEVYHAQGRREKAPSRATVKIEIGSVYIEVRDVDAEPVQEYLMEVLARSC